MNSARHWQRRRLRAVSEIIATILLLAITIIAGTILWTFHVYTPPQPPTTSFDIPGGGSNPVWGDPTDCQPLGSWTYPLSASLDDQWGQAWWNQCEYFSEDEYPTPGNFSSLNTTQIIFTQISSTHMPVVRTEFHLPLQRRDAPAPYKTATTTVLLTGTLSQMTWFPGSPARLLRGRTSGIAEVLTWGPKLGSPTDSLFTRLGIFEPLTKPDELSVRTETAFIVYIHNGGYPLDYACIEASGPYAQPWAGDNAICPARRDIRTGLPAVPLLDVDDYHGAPPWCFRRPASPAQSISCTRERPTHSCCPSQSTT